MKKKHIMFLHVWKAIDHTISLALKYFHKPQPDHMKVK